MMPKVSKETWSILEYKYAIQLVMVHELFHKRKHIITAELKVVFPKDLLYLFPFQKQFSENCLSKFH